MIPSQSIGVHPSTRPFPRSLNPWPAYRSRWGSYPSGVFEDLRGIARHAERQNEELAEISLQQEPPAHPSATTSRIRPEIRAALIVAGSAVGIVALLILIG